MERVLEMESSSVVTLVVSGKAYPDISKQILVQDSKYFKALFSGGFGDSNANTFYFPGWSTLAFEVLLAYMDGRCISLQGNTKQIVENSLRLSEFLCCDSFLLYMRKVLHASWHEIGFKKAVSLAVRLGLDLKEDLINDSLKGAKYITHFRPGKQERALPTVFTYEHLNLAINNERFWQIIRTPGVYCYHFFNYLTGKQQDVIHWVLKKPPHLNKIRRLCNFLKLEVLPWKNVKYILHKAVGNPNSKKCLKLGFQKYFSYLRSENGSRISHLRMSFARGTGMKCLSILEFNMDTWSWQITRFQSQVPVRHCVMSGDYANFMGPNGLIIFRKNNSNLKYVKHVYIGELFRNGFCGEVNWNGNCISKCVVGKNIYLLAQQPPEEQSRLFASTWYSKPTLFKLDVFNYKFDVCTTLQLRQSKIIGLGEDIYIAGYDLQEVNQNTIFKVLRFNVLCNTLTTIAEIDETQEIVPRHHHYHRHQHNQRENLHLLLKKQMLYLFFSSKYAVIDTSKVGNQNIVFRTLECYFTHGWNFRIAQVCSVSDGIMFLLDILHDVENCCDFGLMMAHLNTESNVFQSFGFLPMPKIRKSWTGYEDLQMEQRTANSPPLLETQAFVQGILDLEI